MWWCQSKPFPREGNQQHRDLYSQKNLHYGPCCFEIPSTPCQLCSQTEHSTTVEFNGKNHTCHSVNKILIEMFDTLSNSCSDACATVGETCCYAICNICGEYDLDRDVFINYEGKNMSYGDFNEIFEEDAIIITTYVATQVQPQLASFVSMMVYFTM